MSKIDTTQWKDYAIADLFEVKKGTRLTRANMKDGDIRYIGASTFNNGITAQISNDEHLHPANSISVSYNGSVGEAFYQDEPFWASDDVNVLYPKFQLTRNIYVCCSRPKKRLFFFVSVPIDAVFRAFLTKLVGTDNIYTYSQYLETDLK